MIKTKILATLGPACSDDETLTAMLAGGLDLVRLNFSHGTLADHTVAVDRFRRVARQRDKIVAVVGDLCGPRIRIGSIAGTRCDLHQDQTVTIQRDDCEGTSERLSTNHAAVVDDVGVGDRIFIDDGLVRLRVVDKTPDALICQVDVPGTVGQRKGINLPDSPISTPSLTDKDLTDLDWAIAHDLDYVAMSFVRSPEDLYELRGRLKERSSEMGVIAKIECPEALEHIDEIIENSDAVMVARGDLGVEMNPAQVPLIQKDIVLRCQRANVPVIIATQMLQSMVSSPLPTRAEVSDVANAILDGADVVMLSAETSVGNHPVEAVRMMNQVSQQTEEFLSRTAGQEEPAPPTLTLRVTWAAVHGAQVMARELGARLIGVLTERGFTARLLSKRRLPRDIVALSADERTCRRMCMLYGVIPVQYSRPENDHEMLAQVDQMLIERGLAEQNDLIVVVAGTRIHEPGATNALFMHLVSAEAGSD